jgi:hypothetical protein
MILLLIIFFFNTYSELFFKNTDDKFLYGLLRDCLSGHKINC